MTEMNNSNTAEKVVTIPQTEFAVIIRDKAETATMLSNLIVMWKHEEKLKQHHRPYLHVRKETERMCDHYWKRLSEPTHFRNPSLIASRGSPIAIPQAMADNELHTLCIPVTESSI